MKTLKQKLIVAFVAAGLPVSAAFLLTTLHYQVKDLNRKSRF